MALVAYSRLPRSEVIEAARQRQPESELRRKALKARCRSNLWTQEEIDLAHFVGRDLCRKLRWET